MTPGAPLLALARTLPLAWVAPPLGDESRLVRGVAALALAAAVWPAAEGAPPAGVPMALVVAREVAVGLALGLVAAALFRGAEAAGALVDETRTLRRAPAHRSDSTLLATTYRCLALAVFAAMGGPRLWLAALGDSYAALPVGSAPSATAGAAVVVEVGARVIAWGVALAAPVLAAALVGELLLGLVARSVPTLRSSTGGTARESVLLAAVALTATAAVTALRTGLAGIPLALSDAARVLAR